MRLRMAVVLALATLLALPAGAVARQADDARLERQAARLPPELWEPGPEPVSASGPGLPEEAARVAPLLAVLLLLGAAGAGFALSVLRPVGATAEAEPGLPAVHPPAAASETCAISLALARGRGHFEVRAGSRVIASSPAFAAAREQPVEPTGPAGSAHRRMLQRLVAAGWHLEPEGDAPWYERRLSRPLDAPGDEYGEAQVTARPPRFRTRAGRP